MTTQKKKGPFSFLKKLFLSIFILALLAGSGFAYIKYPTVKDIWQQITSAPQNQQNVESLEQKISFLELEIDQLEERNKKYETAIVQMEENYVALQNYVKEMGDYISQQQALSTTAASASPEANKKTTKTSPSQTSHTKQDNLVLAEGLSEINNRTVQLEEKIYQLSSQVETAKQSENNAVLIVAAVNLRDSIKKGESFDKALRILENATQTTPEILPHIKTLSVFKANRIHSRKELLQQFSGLADEIVNSYRKEKANKSFIDNTALNLSSIISIRKTGDQPGSDSEAIVARAENLIEKGNIEDALLELDTLTGSPKEAAEKWMHDARSLVNLEKASDAIYALVSNINLQNKYNNIETN